MTIPIIDKYLHGAQTPVLAAEAPVELAAPVDATTPETKAEAAEVDAPKVDAKTTTSTSEAPVAPEVVAASSTAEPVVEVRLFDSLTRQKLTIASGCQATLCYPRRARQRAHRCRASHPSRWYPRQGRGCYCRGDSRRGLKAYRCRCRGEGGQEDCYQGEF